MNLQIVKKCLRPPEQKCLRGGAGVHGVVQAVGVEVERVPSDYFFYFETAVKSCEIGEIRRLVHDSAGCEAALGGGTCC